MTIVDFRTTLLLPILQAALAPMVTATTINGQSVGLLTAVQAPPWVCHIDDGMNYRTEGQLTFLDYITIHRLHIQWQAFDVAEAALSTISNELYQRLLARSWQPLTSPPAVPSYKGGVYTLSPLITGFVAVGTTTYRIAEVRSTLGIKLSRDYWS